MPHHHETLGRGDHTGTPRPRAVTLENVSVTYRNGVTALDSVNLHVEPGEMVSVVGLSGSGKSTLIRTINALVPITSGSIRVGDHRVESLRGRQLRRYRGDVGMIFQSFNLAGRASVLSNVLIGRLAHTPAWRTLLGWYPHADKMLACESLDQVGILDKAYHRADTLSGGQQQRVAIARAVSQQPALILADEPVASLDPPTAHAVMRDLRRINQELGITVITNLHAIDLARAYGDRLLGLRSGTIVYDGPTADADDSVFERIYDRPIISEDLVG